jgi:hypothetical protein
MSIFNVNSASFNELTVTGSVNLSGSFLVNNHTIQDVLDANTINAVTFGKLKYEAEVNLNSTSPISPNYIDVNEAPKRNYFRLNRDRTQNNWISSVGKITLSLDNLVPDSENGFRAFIWDILIGNWVGSEITLTSVEYPDTYKTFIVTTGVAYQKQFRSNLSASYYELPMKGYWNPINNDMSLNPDFRFENEHQYSLPDDGRITYVQFTVDEVDSGVDQNRQPIHDDEFSIFMSKNKRKRKEVFEFTSSVTPWTVPHWAEKITIYSIGAGGGGGAGSVGWGHPLDIPYQPSANEEIENGYEYSGFEFATGGGGGAGGNISISEFTLVDINDSSLNLNSIGSTILPKNSELYVYVGKGGTGGQSMTFSDLDYMNSDVKKNHVNSILLGQVSQQLMGEVPTIMYPVNRFVRDYRKFQKPKYESMGKNGGGSSVFLSKNSNLVNNTDIEIIKATGGQGGTHGFSVQFYYQSWHRLCSFADTHYIADYVSPGGGSNLKNSFGNVEVIPGGHGGNGVFTPTARQVLINPKDDENGSIRDNFWMTDDFRQGSGVVRTYPTSSIQSSYKAPNIPWSENYEMPYLRLPHGNISDVSVNEIAEKGFSKYVKNSTIKPNKIAPLGGNGGLGSSWQANDVRDFETYYELDSFNFMKNRTFYVSGENTIRSSIPADIFQNVSNELTNQIYYQIENDTLIPKILGNNILISTPLPNGKTYRFALTETGARGGFNMNAYINTNDEYANLPNVSQTVKDNGQSLPENGYGVGQGGGGGSAEYLTDFNLRNDGAQQISSQSGGNGADGIVIIIAEEL